VSRVLVVTAVGIEARGLARHLGLSRRRGLDGLCYAGSTLDVACAGPRALHLERLADLARTASLVVSAGTCGALAPHLGEGDLVVPDTVLAPGGRRHVLPMWPRLSQTGAILSVDRVVETAGRKARLWQDTAALAVDMESATIVAWAAAMGVPAIVVRGVSDTAARGVPAALANIVDDGGRTRASRAVRLVCRQPRTVLSALSLRRGTAAALRSVAEALRHLDARARVDEQDATRTAG
jgi:adenosylhomocysteine nucleosidase